MGKEKTIQKTDGSGSKNETNPVPVQQGQPEIDYAVEMSKIALQPDAALRERLKDGLIMKMGSEIAALRQEKSGRKSFKQMFRSCFSDPGMAGNPGD